MATGINKLETVSDEAILASEVSVVRNECPLPERSSKVELSYEGKASTEEIIASTMHRFVLANSRKDLSDCGAPTNALFWADNYYAMQFLLRNYTGKIKLIYTDPPYDTGLDFHSRSLQHSYKDNLGLAPWIEMMRRRLILMRELLSKDGSVYIHIGHQRLFHLKIIMDEVFGEENFKNLIVRRKCSSKNSTRKQYQNLNDYILFYGKTSVTYFSAPGKVASEEWVNKEYTKSDADGRYKLVPVHAPGIRNGETGKEWRGMLPPPGKHWQLEPSKLDELDRKGHIHWSKNGNPRRKVYLSENKTIPVTDYWDEYRDAHHQSKLITGYPTEKNIDMLKLIVNASSERGDIVLDPFCGSGTTMQAACELDRKFIGIDQSMEGVKATISRFKHGLKKMGDYVSPENKNDSYIKMTNSGDMIELIVDDEISPSLIKELL
ncbi:site-specific DNA-methyltransferase [Aeromonas veronii]